MQKTFDTIYKRTSSGKVQIWFAEVDGARYRTTSGQEDGKKTVSEWTTVEGKNIGRSNETTPEEQAVLKVESIYKNKLEREYRRDINAIDNKTYTKPMKAVNWKDVKDRPKSGVAIGVQPKLDGMRALASIHGAKSQDGKIIPGFRHIMNALSQSGVFAHEDGVEFDGEGYNHTHAEKFEELMSALKDESPTPEEDAEIREVVQYHLYDLPHEPGPYAILDAEGYLVGGRLFKLHALHDKYLAQFGDMFQVTETNFGVMDDAGTFVNTITEEYLEDKYEGSMVRILSSVYEQKRIKGLIKVKPMMDDEFLILRIEEGNGNWKGHAKRVFVQLKNGRECKATPKGNKAYAKKLFEEREHIEGKKYATVTFLRYTADGMLYLPIMKTIRWDVPDKK